MAVPDWPNTYGYNLFLYPWQTWICGPWDLFIEHGHRLLGYAGGHADDRLRRRPCGVCDSRRWMRWLARGGAGGRDRSRRAGRHARRSTTVLLAKIHGCVGPAFFAFTVALAVVTSRRWLRRRAARIAGTGWASSQRLALLTTLLGLSATRARLAVAAHAGPGSPGDFRIALCVSSGRGRWRWRCTSCCWPCESCVASHGASGARSPGRRRWSALLVVQLGLGAGTWIAKYGWPTAGSAGYRLGAADYVVVAESRTQAWITTAHVATGSLILVTQLAGCAAIAAVCAGAAHAADRSGSSCDGGAGRMSMSLAVDLRRSSRAACWSRVADYVELTKPRIAALVLVTVAVAALRRRLGSAQSSGCWSTRSLAPRWWPPAPAR